MSEQPEALRLAKWCDDMAAPPHSASKATYFQSTAAELRRQHSRIEADEALMRQVFSTLISVGCIFRSVGDKSAMWDDVDAAITTLRTRLEEAK